MKTEARSPIPQLSDFPESERTATVKGLLELCHRQQEQLASQAEQLALQREQIQVLKDEIAVLKGEKGRPKIKPSRLNQSNSTDSGSEDKKKKGRKRGKPGRQKTAQLTIHEERVIEPEEIPVGWVLKGYEP